MASQFDFEAYDATGNLGLVVEVKARRSTSTDWARVMRERLFVDTGLSTKPMFMLVTLDGVYVWKPDAPLRELATYEFTATDILKPYFERAKVDATKPIDPVVLEMVVASWLNDRTRGEGPTHQWLEDAGVSAVLRGGRVIAHDAAA